MIQELIDKQDTYEIIRDRVALIIAQESVNQQALAVAAGKTPELWRLRTFRERYNPWEFLQTDGGKPPTDRAPVICVWFDNSNTDLGASQTIDQQQMDCVINVDIYGMGFTTVLQPSGHIPGDEAASLEVQRAARLVRNILMADTYVSLGFPKKDGIIGRRMITSIQAYQPEYSGQNALKLSAIRLTLQVKIQEFAPQTKGVPLEAITLLTTDENGEIIIDAVYE